MVIKENSSVLRDHILPAAVLILTVLLVIYGTVGTGDKTSEEMLRLTEENVHRAVITCYAAEGAYPENIEYLEENYGLYINHNKFTVNYISNGSNLMPSVTVLSDEEKTEEGEAYA